MKLLSTKEKNCSVKKDKTINRNLFPGFKFCLSLNFLHLSYRGVNEFVEHKTENF